MNDRPGWARVKQVLQSALDRPESGRMAFVRAECGSDAELLREVQSLLSAHARAGDFAEPVPAAGARPIQDVGGMNPVSSQLRPGDRIGSYELMGVLGAGGMGTVYRARDKRLNRDVAIKLLPRTWTLSPDRLARFEREARMLAALNDPHIGAIYGLEDADGVPALVLELVEGETLAERIRRGPLSLTEALAIARQICDALEAAHDRGVIHRDLKPANIKVAPDGTVKVLDFGLAKTIAESDEADAQPTDLRTQTGLVVGTPAYMSPEQARGQPVDRRTDIWAFGCVLFEMLSGRRPFVGETVSDTLAHVLDRDPDWTALPARTPPMVRRLLGRCLDKDVRRRLRDVSDARADLDDAFTAPVTSMERGRRYGARGALVLASLVICVLGLGAAAMLYDFGAETTPVVRMSILPPPDMTTDSIPSLRFALSPDGRNIVMSAAALDGKTSLWIRPLDAVTARQLPGTVNARAPFWSPDSRSIGFFADGKLQRIDIGGGPPVSLADVPGIAFLAGTWSRDGMIVFSSIGLQVIHRVSAEGGPIVPVTTLDERKGEVRHFGPLFFPDGRHFLFVTMDQRGPAGSYVAALDSDERWPLLPGGSNPKFAAGHLLFMRERTLMAQAFDPTSMQLSGDARTVAGDLVVGTAGRVAAFSVSDNGILAYQTGLSGQSTLTWVDRAGQRLYSVGGFGEWMSVDLSPDGRYVAAERHDGPSGDLWIIDLNRNATARFTFSGLHSTHPAWSPDGGLVAFQSGNRVIASKSAASGSVTEDVLVSDNLPDTRYVAPRSWSADGRWLVFDRSESETNYDLWLLPQFGTRQPRRFLQTPHREIDGDLSPNARWLAYTSNESGRPEVYVRSFPSGSAQWQVSMNGGEGARWRRDGKELFYFAGNQIFAVNVTADDTLRAGEPRPLFNTPIARHPLDATPQYSVSPDGQRFLVILPEQMSPITVVVNWIADLSDSR